MPKGRLFGSARIRRKAADDLKADFVIVGLGNPGSKYEHTRHNAGFDVVSILSQRHNIPVRIHKFSAKLGKGEIGSRRVLLCLPQTYMNRSGECLKELTGALGVRADQLIVIYDDIDISAGKIRIRERGSAGSHNGMKSIIYHLQTEEFVRVRVGIGKPEGDLVDYVLGEYSDKQAAFETLTKAADAVEMIITNGITEAQSRYN